MWPVAGAGEAVNFFVGLHQPSDAPNFKRCMVSVNVLRRRKADFYPGGEWILDSGAFTEVMAHGGFRHPVEEYAAQIHRWSSCGDLLAAVSQDMMCEPDALERTGLTLAEHQRLTIERYDALLEQSPPVYVMPVLQGYAPADYARHVLDYGPRLAGGAWVGVGSVCKRNTRPTSVAVVLRAIRSVRPDLRLHLFGVKTTSLADGGVRGAAYSADSMAWSYAARREGRNANDWREARTFCEKIESQPVQMALWP